MSPSPAAPARAPESSRRDGAVSLPSSPGATRGRPQDRGNSRDRKTTPSKSRGGTQICREFLKTGTCKYSLNGACKFSHEANAWTKNPKSSKHGETRNPSEGTKKKVPCARFQVGSCQYGDKCSHAHSLVKANSGGKSCAFAKFESSRQANNPNGTEEDQS